MSDKRDDDVDTEFDQTNGLAGDLTGDSDGTAEGDERSEAERGSGDEAVIGGTPPGDPTDH